MLVSVKRFILLLCCLLPLLLTACGDSTPTRPIATAFSLSGTVSAAALTVVDSDLNDPLAPYVSNDTAATAQNLPNPVTLGGYLTLLPTGVSGDRCETLIDTQDWYQLTLTAGQVITLTIADHDGDATNQANPDFDLYLVDPAAPTINIQTSEGTGRQEMISVLVSGTYDLLVESWAGRSNYVLSVGPAQAAVMPAALRIEDEFVPDEVILRFRDKGKATPQGLLAQTVVPGLTHLAGEPGEPMLYRLATSKNAISPRTLGTTPQALSGSALQQAKRATLDQVKALRKRADVLSADLNYIRRPFLVPDDPLYLDGSQWNLDMLNLPLAWDQTTGSANVVVAVVDTGVLFAHPDLTGRLCTAVDDCAGYDFVSDATSGADGDGIDADPSDPGGASQASAVEFHGTLVAGILGAAGNNTTGIAGVDWNARIMPVRVFGTGVGTSYDLIQGVRYAAGLSNDSLNTPLQSAKILNLSLGGTGYSQTEQDLFSQLYAAGIFSFAAAGNNANNIPLYPASYAGVVSVSAVDSTKKLASYSNFGTQVDLAAPGGDQTSGIISTSAAGTPLVYDYATHIGTSMAVPQVSGVAALMLAADPTLLPSEFDALLAAGLLTEDLGENGVADGAGVRNDSFGYGLIDAHKAVLEAQALAAGGALPPTLFISPSRLSFDNTVSSLPLNLSNSGSGTLNLTAAPTTSARWISLTYITGQAVGLGDYTVNLDRTGLSDGIYAETIVFATDEPATYTVNLLIQVGSPQVADTGLQTISLIDASTMSAVQTLHLAADPLSGSYAFSFAGLNPGSYFVNASSDLDHDGQICDPGEACGRYPSVLAPAAIMVSNRNLSGINFSTGFAP